MDVGQQIASGEQRARLRWPVASAIGLAVVPLTVAALLGLDIWSGPTWWAVIAVLLLATGCAVASLALLGRSTDRRVVEARQAERAAAQENDLRLKMLLRAAPGAVCIYDRTGSCVLLTGDVPGAASPGVPTRAEAVAHAEATAKAVDRALAGESVTTTITVADRVWDARFEPVRDEGGAVSAVVGIGLDVTERVATEQSLRRHVANVNALASMSAGLADSRLDERAVAQTAAHVGATAVGEACHVRLLSADGQLLLPLACEHPDPEVRALLTETFLRTEIPRDEGLPGQVLRTEQVLVVPDASDRTWLDRVAEPLRPWAEQMGLGGFILAPMRVAGRVIGTYTVTRRSGQAPYTPEDVGLVQALADRAAVSIDAARLYGAVTSELDHSRALSNQLSGALDRQRALAEELVGVEERERQRLAEQLHDEPLQLLGAAQLRLALALKDPERAASQLPGVTRMLEEVYGRLRGLLVELAPADLAEGLTTALRATAGGLFASSGIRVAVTGTEPESTPPGVGRLAFLVAREAMVNARKHAGATQVEVLVGAEPGCLMVRVSDDGVGFDPATPAPAGHLGMTTMRQRVACVGGHLQVLSSPGSGTTVTARLPLQPPGPAPTEAHGACDPPASTAI